MKVSLGFSFLLLFFRNRRNILDVGNGLEDNISWKCSCQRIEVNGTVHNLLKYGSAGIFSWSLNFHVVSANAFVKNLTFISSSPSFQFAMCASPLKFFVWVLEDLYSSSPLTATFLFSDSNILLISAFFFLNRVDYWLQLQAIYTWVLPRYSMLAYHETKLLLFFGPAGKSGAEAEAMSSSENAQFRPEFYIVVQTRFSLASEDAGETFLIHSIELDVQRAFCHIFAAFVSSLAFLYSAAAFVSW